MDIASQRSGDNDEKKQSIFKRGGYGPSEKNDRDVTDQFICRLVNDGPWICRKDFEEKVDKD
jgi:hypothetical protein